MYLDFFGLKSPPFENTPDPRFFFASEQHREALAAIEYTIRTRKGFVLITGQVGCGKTTVAHAVCRRCGDQATIVPIVPGHDSARSVLRQILKGLGVVTDRHDEYHELVEALRHKLMEHLDHDRPVVLLIDEAQNLQDESLEAIRMLSNLDTSTRKPVQVVLVGQPELRQRVRDSRHEALRQRVAMSKQLHPFEYEQTHQYILHRLRAACEDGDTESQQESTVVFQPGAVREIHRISGGIPRLINQLCDNCLLLGFVQETKLITAAMVHRVCQDMIPSFDEPAPQSGRFATELSLAGNM